MQADTARQDEGPVVAPAVEAHHLVEYHLERRQRNAGRGLAGTRHQGVRQLDEIPQVMQRDVQPLHAQRPGLEADVRPQQRDPLRDASGRIRIGLDRQEQAVRGHLRYRFESGQRKLGHIRMAWRVSRNLSIIDGQMTSCP